MKKSLSLILWVVAAFILCSCKKDPEVNMSRFEITQEKVLADAINVKITGTFSFPGKIDGMLLKIGREESLLDADCHDIQISDKNFLVSVDGLIPGTKYYYCYSVDYGASKDWVTETEDFTTLAQAPVVETIEVLPIDTTTVRVKCKVVSDGGVAITERGICWNTYGDPTLDDETMTNGEGLGEYTCRINDLQMATTYYVRAYAKNSMGVGFGEEMEFRTSNPITIASVSTVEITDVTATSAICIGNVSSDGGAEVTERGACWSTAENPTLSSSHLANGSGMGSFTVNMTGLNVNATYYVRTYAINEKGIAYGEQKTFTTTEGLAVVTTGSVTEVTATSAKCSGNVTDQGASAVTERGICWSTSHNPTTTGAHANSGTGSGGYTCSMTGLTPNETYYVRAYAINAQGVSYGSEVSFTALEGLPVVTTNDVTDITATSAKCGGNVTDQGGSNVTERGICWSTSHNPTTTDAHANSGTGGGSYTCTMTGLAPGTTYYVRAYAKNTQGISYGEEKQFATLVNKPTVTTNSVTSITQTTATGGGNVTDDGGATVTERGICWSTSQNPTINDSHAANGSGTGSYTVPMTGLTPGTKYYVRAYATNSAGISYGNQVDFTTTATLPTVTTAQVSNITQTTALGGGNVTSDGGADVTERGICWSTSHDPTASGSHATSGTGTGSFTANMTGLTANTTYYVRAYAKNSQGIAYGDEVSFRTSQNISAPTVVTLEVTDITQTTATVNGNVTSDGGANVTERGICWSTSHDPTTSGNHANSGTGTGSFSVQMTGLTPGTTYYVRAYAKNSAGTAYGSEVSFTTQSGGGSGTLTFTANGVTFEMIEVEGGTFWMGAQSTNPSGQNYDSEAYDREQPVHQVTLSSYHIGKFEVTQQLWQAVMGSNPSRFTGDSQRPVESVSWNDCQNFIAALNELCASQLNGKHFSLPTEAQWEFAARGGNQSQGYKYSGSNTSGNVAWYVDNSGSTTHAVGAKQANELGLYDMSGNVDEWCQDWYGSYGSNAQTDPTGPATGSFREYRGGSWCGLARYCRVSDRSNGSNLVSTYSFLGLRLSLR